MIPSKKKINAGLVVPDNKHGKYSNYSPIKEADEENRYAGEESKESKPSPGNDSESQEESPSASKTISQKKGRYGGKAIESSGGASSSLSQSKDPEKNMAS